LKLSFISTKSGRLDKSPLILSRLLAPNASFKWRSLSKKYISYHDLRQDTTIIGEDQRRSGLIDKYGERFKSDSFLRRTYGEEPINVNRLSKHSTPWKSSPKLHDDINPRSREKKKKSYRLKKKSCGVLYIDNGREAISGRETVRNANRQPKCRGWTLENSDQKASSLKGAYLLNTRDRAET